MPAPGSDVGGTKRSVARNRDYWRDQSGRNAREVVVLQQQLQGLRNEIKPTREKLNEYRDLSITQARKIEALEAQLEQAQRASAQSRRVKVTVNDAVHFDNEVCDGVFYFHDAETRTSIVIET